MDIRAARGRFRYAPILLAMVTIGCGSGIAAPSSTTGESPATSIGQLPIDRAQQAFAAFAAANGDTSPSDVESVITTAGAALTLLYGAPGADPDAAVVVTVGRGHFTGSAAKVPAGASMPTGTVLTQVVQADTGERSDWGINDTYPELSSLGVIVRS